MDVLDQLHNKVENMLQRLEQLELENTELREELAQEKQDRQDVRASLGILVGQIEKREATSN